MSLRARLTFWFLVLALVPSIVMSGFGLQQLVRTVEWWDSAGAEDALSSSVVVARTALKRLEGGLRLSAVPLVDLTRQPRTLALGPGGADRMFVERYLESTGLDVFQLYERSPRDTTWKLRVDVAPSGVTRVTPLDLAPELNARRIGTDRPVQSVTGVFGLLDSLPPDSLTGNARLSAVGYALPADFFLRLSELQLGLGTFRTLSGYAAIFKTYFRLTVVLVLILIAAIAVFAARALARHLSRPIAEMAARFAQVDGDTLVRVSPRGAPEVRRLGEAFNAMTGRLVQARADLARAERAAAWQGVARQVAHEIRNPLTAVNLALSNLERELDRLPEEGRARSARSITALRREMESLGELADSFHSLGELPAVHVGPVDVNALVESLIAVAPWEHVTIEAALDPARPVAHADERQLRRVLRNLVKNACEAQPGGGRVVVRTRTADGRVAIDVEDEGQGMDDATLSRIFEPGFSTKARGSGVGLTVTRRVIEQQGGAIEVASTKGEGTRFTAWLPAERKA